MFLERFPRPHWVGAGRSQVQILSARSVAAAAYRPPFAPAAPAYQRRALRRARFSTAHVPGTILSVLTINDRPVFRRGLTSEQGTLLSSYMVKEFFSGGTEPRMVQVWDHLVEVPGRDGEPVRLTIRVRGFGFDLPEAGRPVSVLVNRRRTKAAFDPDDPKISLGARHDRHASERKAKAAKDKARFEALRDGRDQDAP